MQFVGKVISSVSEFYRDINPSTLSGAIDVIVVEDVKSGELTCSPFHVRFGKLQLLRPQEKAVELRVNGVTVGEELRMKVGEAGETFFVLSRQELGMTSSDLPSKYLTSPLIGPEMPVTVESVEEFLLDNRIERNNEKGLNSTILTASTSSVVNGNISNTTSTASNTTGNTTGNTSNTRINTTSTITDTVLNQLSPEWKWEWGDLPIKKDLNEDEVNVNVNVDVNANANVNVNVNLITENQENVPITVELYEYLTEKEYLLKSHEILNRFPARSMITRIYRIDRGLHFESPTQWPDHLNSSLLLNESTRLTESDFLLNPNVIIEESSRLIYQFTWENRKVVLSGSVGAAIVFYAQTYARILPMEIVTKLAEIAAIRMAKRKFGFGRSATVEDNENAEMDENSVPATETEINHTEPVSAPQTDLKPGELELLTDQTDQKSSLPKPGSGWRSWWSRSSTGSINENGNLSTGIVDKSDGGSQNNNHVIGSPVNDTFKLNFIPSANQSSESPSPTIINESSTPPSLLISTGSSLKIPSKLALSECGIDELLASRVIQEGNVNVPSSDGSDNMEITISSTDTANISSVSLDSNTDTTLTSDTNTSVSGITSDTVTTTTTTTITTIIPDNDPSRSEDQCLKSLRLPSHLLKRLNLKPGVNTVSYTVNTRLQGTATCQSRIFLWRSNSHVVISDIDGTITKSDALGHLFTMVGKDWTHVGVAQLYSKIAANGYEFLYLTSRAIGQAASTRGYLKGVEQDRLQLPDGPVIMSPDRLFTALHREVIQRRPDEFKIACLRDIQKLFADECEQVSTPGISSSEDESKLNTGTGNDTKIVNINIKNSNVHQNPFYAGFGNRPTDTKSYKAVGISASRIFLINPAGDLKLDKLTFYTPYSASSYSKLTEEVDKVFPPVRSPSSLTRSTGDEAFTDLQYWHGHGGDVRMDLVQMALKTVNIDKDVDGEELKGKMKMEAVVDESGKPVSPVTLQMQLGSPVSKTKTKAPKLPSRGERGEEIDTEIEANDADSENDNEKGSGNVSGNDEYDDYGDILGSIDSFPFI